jgi:hypothetical protein
MNNATERRIILSMNETPRMLIIPDDGAIVYVGK